MGEIKETGHIKRIDDLGRIVIPKEIRREIGAEKYQQFEIMYDEEAELIVLRKYEEGN